jgi:hypothetical protein
LTNAVNMIPLLHPNMAHTKPTLPVPNVGPGLTIAADAVEEYAIDVANRAANIFDFPMVHPPLHYDSIIPPFAQFRQ